MNVDALRGGSRRVVLVLYHLGRTRTVPLQSRQPVTIGRGPNAEVQLEDETISRAHARVELVGDEVWVEDLGSKNGTLVNGSPVGRARLTPHDRLVVGSATAFLHIPAPLVEDVDGVEPHEQFIGALDDAIQRTRGLGRKLALIFFQTDGSVEPGEWLSRVAGYTRPYDRLGVYSTAAAEIMLWDTDRAGAEALAERLLRDSALAVLAPRCGLALAPDAGMAAEALIEAAHRAALAPGPGSAIRWAPAWGTSLGPRSGPAPVVASPAMRRVFATALQLGRSAIPVLITGETGTGKELVARAIHEAGERRSAPLVCVNCAAIPQSLIESELFGHERGAFTGAERRTKGLFEEAHQGTVLLDEIGELPLAAQAALLRVLETKRFCRVGSKKEIEVDVRVIAATHRDLEAMCGAGSFRPDLLYRINSVMLPVPALRERPEDIPPLAEHFLEQACQTAGCPEVRIAPEALALLVQYGWPGNVRELRNVVERGVALADGPIITVAHLPERLLQAGGGGAPVRVGDTASPGQGRALPAAVVAVLEGPRGPAAEGFREFVQRTEAALLAVGLREAQGNKAAVARGLRIPLRTLTEKIRAYGLEPGFREDPELLEALEAVVPEAGEMCDFKHRIRLYETALLTWALGACGGSRAAVAEKLRLPARTLRDKLRASGL
jgi:DNA-binding NtrC family response regulator